MFVLVDELTFELLGGWTIFLIFRDYFSKVHLSKWIYSGSIAYIQVKTCVKVVLFENFNSSLLVF